MANKKDFKEHGTGGGLGLQGSKGAARTQSGKRHSAELQSEQTLETQKRMQHERTEELNMRNDVEEYEGDGELYPDLVDAAIKAGEAAAAEDLKKDANKLVAENQRLSKELGDAQEIANSASAKIKEANDRAARVQADWENYRKRTAAERLEERKHATEGLIEKLLPGIDDLERAIEHTQKTDSDASLEELANGVAAVHAKIIDVLRGEGVEVIDSVGTPFDPTKEQAVGNVESKELPDESVAEVLRKGYAVSGKVIRPAMVTVSHKPKK